MAARSGGMAGSGIAGAQNGTTAEEDASAAANSGNAAKKRKSIKPAGKRLCE